MPCNQCGDFDGFIDENESEINDHPMSSTWFRKYTRSVCEFQGLEPGTAEFEQCRMEAASNALSPARATAKRGAISAMSVVESLR